MGIERSAKGGSFEALLLRIFMLHSAHEGNSVSLGSVRLLFQVSIEAASACLLHVRLAPHPLAVR